MDWASPRRPQTRDHWRRKTDLVPRPGEDAGGGGLSPRKPDWGSQLTTGQRLPGFPSRGMRDMKGKFLQKKTAFLRVFCPHLWFQTHGFFAESWRTFWKGWGGGGVSSPRSQGRTRWGPPGQPSSLPLEGWHHPAPVLKIVHQEEVYSTLFFLIFPWVSSVNKLKHEWMLEWIIKSINDGTNIY